MLKKEKLDEKKNSIKNEVKVRKSNLKGVVKSGQFKGVLKNKT